MVYRYFRHVLGAVLKLHKHVIKLPDSDTPLEIKNNGSSNGNAKEGFVVERMEQVQNVLVAITFDIKFSYVLAGWEGSAHDSRVLNDALNWPRGLQIPEGRYYLGDAGYGVRKGVICPYRSIRYHLNEFSDNPPRNSKELFNLPHSSLHITIERCFGVLKKCFRVLDAEPFGSFPTQVDVVLACCIIHNHIIGVDPLDSIVNDVALDTQFENGSTSRRVQQSQREIQGENREWV
uniref:DDE Tnp4 domain-containing protein n=1 Tax=Fagus sylvatica TaxID=28930 RepID=A0A2N9IW88_FAGSY